MPIPLGILAVAGAGAGAAGSYELIQSTILSSSASTITFTAIPSTYKHLQIRAVTRSTDSGTGFDTMFLQFNSDSSANYAWHRLQGTGSIVASASATSQNSITLGDSARSGETANVFTAQAIEILDYASSSKNTTTRTFVGQAVGLSSPRVRLLSGLWINTNAVTNISLFQTSSNFVAGSRFSLYGIK